MIIRSQNKNNIINFNSIDTICIEKNPCDYEVVCFNGSEESKLGAYTTEEKAIKVLDMIQDAYCKMKSSDCIFCGSSIDLCKASQEKIDNFIETNRKLYVFQIPQDSEV